MVDFAYLVWYMDSLSNDRLYQTKLGSKTICQIEVGVF
jgi:hypothetical protein